MQPMVEEFAAAVADIEVAEPRIGLVSNVTGRLAGAGYGSPQYWAAHVGAPVRFFDGVRAAEAAGAGLFVELGPGAALTGGGGPIAEHRAGRIGAHHGQGSARDGITAGRDRPVVHPRPRPELGGRVRRAEPGKGGIADVRLCAAEVLVGRRQRRGRRPPRPPEHPTWRSGCTDWRPRTSTVCCWSWSASMRRRSWGIRAATPSTTIALSGTSDSTR